jgi:hypothetical protein
MLHSRVTSLWKENTQLSYHPYTEQVIPSHAHRNQSHVPSKGKYSVTSLAQPHMHRGSNTEIRVTSLWKENTQLNYLPCTKQIITSHAQKDLTLKCIKIIGMDVAHWWFLVLYCTWLASLCKITTSTHPYDRFKSFFLNSFFFLN